MIEIKFPANIPASEFSQPFVQGMADRMAMAYLRYGAVADAYPDQVDALESLRVRLRKYEQTGNTEYLMDAANFAMIEFIRPRHPKARFAPTDSAGSPGRKWHGEIDPSRRGNRPETWTAD